MYFDLQFINMNTCEPAKDIAVDFLVRKFDRTMR